MSGKRFHVNPTTGQVGACTARIKCRFNLSEEEHFKSPGEAREAFENKMSEKTFVTHKGGSNGPRSVGEFANQVSFTNSVDTYGENNTVTVDEDSLKQAYEEAKEGIAVGKFVVVEELRYENRTDSSFIGDEPDPADYDDSDEDQDRLQEDYESWEDSIAEEIDARESDMTTNLANCGY